MPPRSLKLRAITMPTGMSTPQPMAASQACACGGQRRFVRLGPAEVYAGWKTCSGAGAGGPDARLSPSTRRCDAVHSLLPRSHNCGGR